MKLKKLLEVIPNNYEICLADFDKNICTITCDTKEDAIMCFAQRARLIK